MDTIVEVLVDVFICLVINTSVGNFLSVVEQPPLCLLDPA